MEFKGGVVSKRDAFFSRHRMMSRWALGVLAALTLIIGISILRASPPDDQDKNQDNPQAQGEQGGEASPEGDPE